MTNRTDYSAATSFAVNDLNALSTANRVGTNIVVGGNTTATATNVMVTSPSGSGSATLYSDNTFARYDVGVTNGNNVISVSALDSLGRTANASSTYSLPSSTSYIYDLNGNLTSDGLRAFDYDAENQLVGVTVTNQWRSEFTYDGRMRRRIRREYEWANSSWNLVSETHYLCDGMFPVQERDETDTVHVTYTRGRDLSGTLEGAGGIGGLIARTEHSGGVMGHAFYHADGNGNVSMLTSPSQISVAKYLFDPYGNLLAKAGPLADANVYRFSSKESHPKSGLIYYGYRFFDPSVQRWLNHDPMQEKGDKNLFRFCANNAITHLDSDGRDVYVATLPGVFLWMEVTHVDVYVDVPDEPGKVLLGSGAFDKAYHGIGSVSDRMVPAGAVKIKTTEEQDRIMIDFMKKDESNLFYVYCVARASEILSVGGIQGIGFPGSGAWTASGLLSQIRAHNDAVTSGVENIVFDNSWMLGSGD